jgi:hypothetical protein
MGSAFQIYSHNFLLTSFLKPLILVKVKEKPNTKYLALSTEI